MADIGVNRVILVGAGCPLANSIAKTLYGHAEIYGISTKDFSNTYYSKIDIFNFLDESIAKERFNEITESVESFVIITCTGKFPLRKKLSEYTCKDQVETFESNILGFTIPYRSVVENARKAKKALFMVFGSVSQSYKYPKLSIFTAMKDALKTIVHTASHEESSNDICFCFLNLSTLDQEKEQAFTKLTSDKYLPCSVVAQNIHSLFLGFDKLPFYTEQNNYIHSDDYYSMGYFSRIPD